MTRALATFLLLGMSAHGGESYLARLKPVVELRLDASPEAGVRLDNGLVLTRPEAYASSLPKSVPGPHAWTGSGWDFSVCDGPYLLKVSEAMNRVGSIETTRGLSLSFWVRGEYSGRNSRIMAGCFDIGTSKDGIWGGTADYQNAQTDRRFKVWDKQWHHIVTVVDWKTADGNVRIYLDGKLAGTRSGSYLKDLCIPVGYTWSFGARNAHDPGFDFGALAHIAVFDRPLTEDEIGYINAGEVFAGSDQAVAMPNRLTLNGCAPAGVAVLWRQVEGPAGIRIEQAGREQTGVTVAVPGDYVFELKAGARRATTRVKVLPNQPPQVVAGEGLILDGGRATAELLGRASDSSVAVGQKLTTRWEVLSTPPGGTAVFAEAAALETTVQFEGHGLYALALTANDGELQQTSTIDALVGAKTDASYLALLTPVAMVGFERPAHRTVDAMADDTGSAGITV